MAAAQELVTTGEQPREREVLSDVVVRFAGDSGDGMQLTGLQFTDATAVHGNDLATFPDFPAEIRAPAGTLFGVSAFQINFGTGEITTPGDDLDVLVAMNPAALRTNLSDLHSGGLLIVDSGAFGAKNLRKAGYDRNPLDNGELADHRRIKVDITRHVQEAVAEFGLTHKQAVRCKNMWVLGLLMWLYGREREPTLDGLATKFAHVPAIRDANIAALDARARLRGDGRASRRDRALRRAAAARHRARPVPQRQRDRGDGLRLARGERAVRAPDHVRLLSDHPRVEPAARPRRPQGVRGDDVPGGGRDGGRLRRNRRILGGRGSG